MMRWLFILLVVGACTVPAAHDEPQPPVTTDTQVPATRPVPPPTYQDLEPGRRLIAIGDVHGDRLAAQRALRLAGVIDANDNWSGSQDMVVQVGDQLDRGDDEREILIWFAELAEQAFAAGGGFYALNGNHETMNVSLDFRYVTPGGYTDFADVPVPSDPEFDELPPEERGRTAAFRPGGPFAMMLAEQNTVIVLGRTVFVHGGVLPQHFDKGLRALNAEVQAWMRGERGKPSAVRGDESLVWSRHFSRDTGAEQCALLAESLDLAGADRMVVAHTVQSGGINSVCGEQVWRVDVGLAAHYGGSTEVLEIQDDVVRVLRVGR